MKTTIANESGFVLVTAMVLLLMLSFLGISGLNTSSLEVEIAASDKLFKEAFYNAEGGAACGAQVLENATTQSLEQRTVLGMGVVTSFIDGVDGTLDDTELMTTTEWTVGRAQNCGGGANPPSYFMVDEGVPPGEPVGMDESKMHRFMVVGKSETVNDRIFVDIGYRKRY